MVGASFPLLISLIASPNIRAETSVPATPGFADLHNHMMAEYAYGGAWFHGKHEGDEAHAMSPCSGNAWFLGRPVDHASVRIPGLAEFVGMIPGTHGDTGLHLQKRGGYPNYDGWPAWDTIAHQQVWEGFLKKAHQDGLSLIIISAVNFKPLCDLMPPHLRKYDCDDHSAVERQIDAIHRFARNHSSWTEVVTDPAQTRNVIASGKLAIVIGIEISDLFPRGDWKKQLHHLYHRGVRSLQIVHQLDNRFVGTATHVKIFNFFQMIRNIVSDFKFKSFDTDSDGFNKRGLTREGASLVGEMMNLRMIVDLAHVSERGLHDIVPLLESRAVSYPAFVSHGHDREMMDDEKGEHEKATPPWVFDLIRRTGGMFGVRTGPERVKTFENSVVPNDCDGSSKSFAQVVQSLTKTRGVSIGFGTDFNGFIQQLRPRFGDDKETCGAARTKSARRSQQRVQKNPLGRAYDRTGFGHIGQVADVLAELKNFGVDTSALENSTDRFIRVWEKSYDSMNSPVIERGRTLAGE